MLAQSAALAQPTRSVHSHAHAPAGQAQAPSQVSSGCGSVQSVVTSHFGGGSQSHWHSSVSLQVQVPMQGPGSPGSQSTAVMHAGALPISKLVMTLPLRSLATTEIHSPATSTTR